MKNCKKIAAGVILALAVFVLGACSEAAPGNASSNSGGE